MTRGSTHTRQAVTLCVPVPINLDAPTPGLLPPLPAQQVHVADDLSESALPFLAEFDQASTSPDARAPRLTSRVSMAEESAA
jgi:hypothetical protein